MKCTLLLFLSFFGCFIEKGEEFIDKINYDKSGTKIERREAKKLISASVLSFASRCPEYGKSGFNTLLNWSFLLSNRPECRKIFGSSSSGGGSNSDSSKDSENKIHISSDEGNCAEVDYVSRKAIQFCILSVLAQSCEKGKIESEYFATFVYCSKALNSDIPFPFLFF